MDPGGSTSPSSAGAPLDATQRAIRTLARRIVRAPLVGVDGTLCRAVRAEYLRRTPPEPLYHRGSLQGRRYTPPGGPAGLYLAHDQPTAFAEIRDLVQGAGGFPFALQPHNPVTLVYVEVELGRVLDLTNKDTRRELRVSRRAILAEWEIPMLTYLAGAGTMPLTQQIGEAAHLSTMVSGILYPSARWAGGRCLVVYPDRLTAADRVYAYDPTGVLSQRLARSAP
jgi:RES domain-containing protein